MAWRSASIASAVDLAPTASIPNRTASSGSTLSWLPLCAARARDLAVMCSLRAWLREMSAKISSPTATTATPRLAATAIRWRREAAARLANTYPCWSAVASGSLPAPPLSHNSAAASSAPRSRKLRSRPSPSHSKALSSQRVCCLAYSRSVSSACATRSTPTSKSSPSSNAIQLRWRISSGTSSSGTRRNTAGTIRLLSSSA